MDDTAAYYPDGVTKITNLLRATFADYFHAYYQGEPTDIPVSLLPAIIVRPVSSSHSVQDAPTGFDMQIETVMVKIVMNKMDDVDASPTAQLTEAKLKRLVAGRDPVTGTYVDTSVMGVLRRNITLEGTVIDQNNTVEFQFDVQTDNTLTSEAWITLTLRELVPVTRN